MISVFSAPDRERLAIFLRLYVLLTLLFAAVYGGSNWISSVSGRGISLHFAWELGIPLVPQAIVVYFSIAILFWLPLFACDIDGLRALGRRLAIVTLVAGLIFVVLPVRTGFPRTPPQGAFHEAFSTLYGLDGAFNALPSLHITYSTLVFCALARRVVSRRLRLVGGLWYVGICVSVLLVHQHHVADIVGGIALAWVSGLSRSRRRRPIRDSATP